MQPAHLLINLISNVLYRPHRVGQRETTQFDSAVEVGNRELAIDRAPVVPDAPHEEREDGFGVKPEPLFEIEDATVGECHHDGHVMQRRSIALKVLDGIGIGMKHVRALPNLAGSLRGALDQIVVVGIHTGNHRRPQDIFLLFPLEHEIHQHRLLAALQSLMGRQHHFEIALLILIGRKHGAPEQDIIITLHIGHDSLARVLRAQPVGRLHVLG